MLRNHLVSVNSACRAMTLIGILVGAMFPIYSALFFGSGSFRLLYVASCLAAGFLIAQACGYVLKEFLHGQRLRQEKILGRITGDGGKTELHNHDNSKLETFLEGNTVLVRRVESLSHSCVSLLEEISSRHHELDETARALVKGNESELAKEREVQVAGEEMQTFFQSLLSDIEELLARAEERSDISRRMSAANDTIAENIRDYSSSVLGTSSSIEEIAFSIKESTANVQALSKSTEQTAGSISQISTAIAEVRDNIQKAAESSVNVRLQAQEGMRAMTATLQAMREIETSSEESFNAINRLAVHSARVGEFLNIIKEVVEQTNLLSLNASIIAAQAGERGKAFSVVAEEVRSLAHRTALSATEIDELVKNIQKETAAVQRAIAKGKDRGKSGVKISALTGESLQKIEESATEVSQMVQKIAASTVKQAAGSRLISDEAEKNLERGRQVTRAIQEQEKGIVMIVQELESMRLLAQNIANATVEQSNSNRQFLENVLIDVDQVVQLRNKGLQQSGLEDTLQGYVQEVGSLMEANAEKAGKITREIDRIAQLVTQLTREVETFSLPTPEP